ncbi:MAG: hypothetical protein IKD76_04240 [Clostridia bacterium]|nr:hypothetical protein [Clostridia bacterium]
MDIKDMRNIVILKNLPSNIVEEAFVVLKKNQKIKKLEYAENNADKFSSEKLQEKDDEYVVREAELLISNYINKLEKQDFTGKKLESAIIKKYKRLKNIAIVLGIFLLISFWYIAML